MSFESTEHLLVVTNFLCVVDERKVLGCSFDNAFDIAVAKDPRMNLVLAVCPYLMLVSEPRHTTNGVLVFRRFCCFLIFVCFSLLSGHFLNIYKGFPHASH
jgi:hypothetical protein